jgi:hypothetical protein
MEYGAAPAFRTAGELDFLYPIRGECSRPKEPSGEY